MATDTTGVVILFWDFLIFYQIFLSPEVKQSLIISKKKDIYKSPLVLPSNLKSLKIRKFQENLHTARDYSLVSFPKWKFCKY